MRLLTRPTVLLLLVGLACALPVWSADGVQSLPRAVSDADIEAALQVLARDPNLLAERSIRTLSFDQPAQEPPRKRSGFLKWLGELLAWLAGSVRWLFWLVIALLLAGLVVYLVRLTLTTRRWRRDAKAWAPTHVQSLDIRPESLPDDIGAAAREFWDRGAERTCLSLLYRGLLSRLVHVFDVGIRDSSTEGDCLRLAAAALPADRIAYVAQLIRVWQQSVYGGQLPTAEVVHALCADFAPTLDRLPQADRVPSGATASEAA